MVFTFKVVLWGRPGLTEYCQNNRHASRHFMHKQNRLLALFKAQRSKLCRKMMEYQVWKGWSSWKFGLVDFLNNTWRKKKTLADDIRRNFMFWHSCWCCFTGALQNNNINIDKHASNRLQPKMSVRIIETPEEYLKKITTSSRLRPRFYPRSQSDPTLIICDWTLNEAEATANVLAHVFITLIRVVYMHGFKPNCGCYKASNVTWWKSPDLI